MTLDSVERRQSVNNFNYIYGERYTGVNYDLNNQSSTENNTRKQFIYTIVWVV